MVRPFSWYDCTRFLAEAKFVIQFKSISSGRWVRGRSFSIGGCDNKMLLQIVDGAKAPTNEPKKAFYMEKQKHNKF